MKHRRVTRRRVMAIAGTASVSSLCMATERAELLPENAEDALLALKEGNVRFAAGKTLHAHQSANWREHLVGGQKPFATILGCSDSRVPVELVFDQGFGDLFVVRVAGNVVAPDVVGSLAYAVAHLMTPLVVVVGHENCGAVTAAVNALAGKMDALASVNALARLIEPGLPEGLLAKPANERIPLAVEANVRWSTGQLAKQTWAKPPIVPGPVRIVGAVYDLKTGRVRFLDS
ncbi:MAG: carbonic anhydrase [Planctomycetota bacterium]